MNAQVYFDNAHGQKRWGETGFPARGLETTFQSLGGLFCQLGFQCVTDNKPLDEVLLSGSDYAALVIPPPTGSFKEVDLLGGIWIRKEDSRLSVQEIDAILSFISSGGRLLAFSYRFGDPFTGANLGELFAALGCLLNSDAIIDLDVVGEVSPLSTTFETTKELIEEEWALGAVQKLIWRPVTTFTILRTAKASPIVIPPQSCVRLEWGSLRPNFHTAPLCVSGEYGKGKFVLFGGPHVLESSEFGLLSDADNLSFTRNIIQWLLAKTHGDESDITHEESSDEGDSYQNPNAAEIQDLWDDVCNSQSNEEKGGTLEAFSRFFIEESDILTFMDEHLWSMHRHYEIDLLFECISRKPLWASSNGLIPVECKNWQSPVDAARISRFANTLSTMTCNIGLFIARSFSEKALVTVRDSRIRDNIVIGLISDKELRSYLLGEVPAVKIIEASILRSRVC